MLPSLVNSRQRGEENRKDCSREGPHICKAGRHPRTRTSSCGGANHMIIHIHVDTIYLSIHTYITYMCRTSKELGTAFTNMHNRSSSCSSSSNNNNNHNRRCSWGQRKDRSSTPRSSSYHHDQHHHHEPHHWRAGHQQLHEFASNRKGITSGQRHLAWCLTLLSASSKLCGAAPMHPKL